MYSSVVDCYMNPDQQAAVWKFIKKKGCNTVTALHLHNKTNDNCENTLRKKIDVKLEFLPFNHSV